MATNNVLSKYVNNSITQLCILYYSYNNHPKLSFLKMTIFNLLHLICQVSRILR